MNRQAILIFALIVVSAFVLVASFWPRQPNLSDQAANSFGFDKALNLSNNTQDSVYGQVSASGDSVYVVWQDSLPSSGSAQSTYSGRNYDIFAIQSSDGGSKFGSPINISSNPGFSEHPQSVAYQEGAYIVWADNELGNREVMFSKLDKSGSESGETVNISSSKSDSFNQEMAANSDDIYIVWLEQTENGSELLFKSSHDGGKTFGKALQISNNVSRTTLPKIAADGQGVHIAWSFVDDPANSGLYYSKSSDRGESFEESVRLSAGTNMGEPQIVARNSAVYVVSGGSDTASVDGLFLATSVDGGEYFTTQTINANGTFVNPLNVEAVLDDSSGILYVAGQVHFSGNEEILLLPLNVSSNAAKEIGISNLSNNEKISECPSISISGNSVLVVWEDLTPGNHEILYARGMKI